MSSRNLSPVVHNSLDGWFRLPRQRTKFDVIEVTTPHSGSAIRLQKQVHQSDLAKSGRQRQTGMAVDIVSEPRPEPRSVPFDVYLSVAVGGVLTGPIYGQMALTIEVSSGVLSVANEVIE